VYGVRYPATALDSLNEAQVAYRGWIPNYRVPEVFSKYRVTMHVPRRPYRERLPGIPTIRVFEALACGIPLVSAPWEDSEQLFSPGTDFLMARDEEEARECLRAVLHDSGLAEHLRRSGWEAIRARHTCAHRVDELLKIYRALAVDDEVNAGSAPGWREVPAEIAQ
jgi:spore maturation protein CgeB